METLIESIMRAVASGATDDDRAIGARSCRTILATLEAKPGESLVAAPNPTSSPIASIVAALRDMPPDQLLDLAIARLRSALPAEATTTTPPLKFHLLTVPTKP